LRGLISVIGLTTTILQCEPLIESSSMCVS
jgi:hypothetical protein